MKSRPSALRDFTVDRRVWLLSAVALVIGALAAGCAVFLLRAIAFCTNLFYYHRFSIAMVGPAGGTWPHWAMPFVPIVGGIIVGFMAHYGSEKIRGHGIPEAIEAILLHGARVEPKVAVLKPVSAAVAIGSGGPFGAEGPIIMTGGAVGSLIAQWLKLSDNERTTLLVAGAAAGMSATFAAPIASILLAVELLLFEWRPRSLVPVAVASVIAGTLRIYWLGAGPLFPVSIHGTLPMEQLLIAAVPIGLIIGVAGAFLSKLMYGLEDQFEHLSTRFGIHWMWWPAIGAIAVGVGGIFFPRGLGVGYDNIAELLRGSAPVHFILGVMIAKSLMWAFSLSSGTSGGVLAPIMMIGASISEGIAQLLHLPTDTQAVWALMGMGAMLSGALGVPMTAILFALEVTHGFQAILPLVLCCTAAYLATSLMMSRSILTEKVARRGYHLSREYGVDPLEIITVHEVMNPLPPGAPGAPASEIGELFAYTDQTCRAVAEDMAVSGILRMPVVDRETSCVCGSVGAAELLAGRRRAVRRESERHVAFLRQPHSGQPHEEEADNPLSA